MKNPSIECRCSATLTCGYCLRNRKPWFYSIGNNGAAIPVLPPPPEQPTTDKRGDQYEEGAEGGRAPDAY